MPILDISISGSLPHAEKQQNIDITKLLLEKIAVVS